MWQQVAFFTAVWYVMGQTINLEDKVFQTHIKCSELKAYRQLDVLSFQLNLSDFILNCRMPVCANPGPENGKKPNTLATCCPFLNYPNSFIHLVRQTDCCNYEQCYRTESITKQQEESWNQAYK